MPIFKATFLMNMGRQGFSESWYRDSADYSACLIEASILGARRKNLLGRGAIIEGIRVSDVTITGDSALTQPGNVIVTPVTGDGSERDNGSTCWNCRIEATALYRRNLALRGIADRWVIIDPTSNTSSLVSEFLARFNEYRDILVARQWRIKVLRKDLEALINARISAMAFAAGKATFTAAGHGLVVGDLVKIKGGIYAGLNKVPPGPYVVQTVAGNDFIVAYPTPGDPLPVYIADARASRQVKRYDAVTNAFPTRVGSRRTGRAFFQSAGRRPARR